MLMLLGSSVAGSMQVRLGAGGSSSHTSVSRLPANREE